MAPGDQSDPLLQLIEAFVANHLGYLILLGIGFLLAQFFLNLNRAPIWSTCRRDELAYLRISEYGSRGCLFVRKDGSVAVRTPSMIYSIRQLMGSRWPPRGAALRRDDPG